MLSMVQLPVCVVQVPSLIYDRVFAIFATAFGIDIMGSCFEAKAMKLQFILLPAFIKGLAAFTVWKLRMGHAVLVLDREGNM